MRDTIYTFHDSTNDNKHVIIGDELHSTSSGVSTAQPFKEAMIMAEINGFTSVKEWKYISHSDLPIFVKEHEV